jgi:uncharacterized protein (DUF934 family)
MSMLLRLTEQGVRVHERDSRTFVALDRWLAAPEDRDAFLLLAPTDDPAALSGLTAKLAAIAIEFPKPTDGRGFSTATLVRTRLGWRGELRAVGAVARDQLGYMARCGFDTFDLREGEDVEACMQALTELSVRYQRAVDEPLPLFRRRAAALSALERQG